MNFLNIDEEEAEDNQSGTANLGAEGQKITPANDEAVDQVPAGNISGDGEVENKGDGVVDIHLLDE